MPIEVEGPGGVVVEFPDGTTTSVMQRAMAARFPAPNAPKPTTRPPKSSVPGENLVSNSQAQSVFDKASARLESKIAHLPEATKRKAREAFYADPSIQRLRGNISDGDGSKDPRVKAIARANIAKLSPADRKSAGFLAEAGQATFGLTERLAAAGRRLSKDADGKDYGDELNIVRAERDQMIEEGNPVGNFLGMLFGAGATGAGIENLAARALPKIAAAAPGVARMAEGAARFIPRTTKAVGASAAGAGYGLAQSAGDGTDKSTATTIGAVAGPVGLAAGKGLSTLWKITGRPVVDFLGLTQAPGLLKRFTTTNIDEIKQAAAKYRQATGGKEPTLYELLPQTDRNRLSKAVVGRSNATAESTAAKVGRRVQNVGPEMRDVARRATETDRAEITKGLTQDLEAARGAPNVPGAPDTLDYNALPIAATNSPLGLRRFQRTEAASRMEPVDGEVVADDLASLFPTGFRTNKKGEIEEYTTNPDVTSLISSAAGALRLRPNLEQGGGGIKVNEITAIVDKLSDIPPSSPQYLTAQDAINQLIDKIGEKNPRARQLAEQMRERYAARFRMQEGMEQGAMTRTMAEAPPTQKASNAFETPEGAQGRLLGQANALDRQLSGTERGTLSTVGGIAESGQTQAALRENLGKEASSKITEAAQAQSRSVRNLASLSKEKASEAETMAFDDLGMVVLGLSPTSMIRTKVAALHKLMQSMRMPERRAQQLVDMLFSQDARITNRAIGLLNRAGNPGREALDAITRGARMARVAEQTIGGGNSDPSLVPDASAADTMPVDDGGNPIEDAPQEFGSYDEMLADWEANEDPEIVDLIARQSGQESGGQQFGDDGNPLQSSAGAIGVMQVMPDTAPEAAELAGLPWDEDAYYQDPAYNKLLGIAYMKEMLRRYDGDVKLALAAYNAGPGAVDRTGGVPNYAETQNYVDRITR